MEPTVNAENWFEIHNPDTVTTPALLLYPDRIRTNLQQLIQQADDVSRLRPHVKTHKLAPIVRLKLELGIHKFKTATLAETQMVAAAGGPDILWAYQPVGPNVPLLIDLVRRFPQTRLSTLIDDPAIAAQLADLAAAAHVSIGVFLDLNVGMHRSGIAPDDRAFDLYQRLTRLPGLEVRGLHAYDGHIRAPQMDVRRHQWQVVAEQVQAFRARLLAANCPVPNIVAGGSSTSGLWLEIPSTEVGAGTAALWDYGQLQTCPESPLQPAAVLMARVISRPQDDLICVDLGHKAVAAEMPQPRVHWFGLEDAQPVLQSEEHLVLRTPRAAEFPPGSLLYGLPYHICPTTALYDEVWHIEQQQATGRWPVTARHRQLTPTAS
jgi:D-serine deaminase-like pyridoxal phosphate-dependent protein